MNRTVKICVEVSKEAAKFSGKVKSFTACRAFCSGVCAAFWRVGEEAVKIKFFTASSGSSAHNYFTINFLKNLSTNFIGPPLHKRGVNASPCVEREKDHVDTVAA